MFKRLEEIIKKVKGNVLTIGLDESLLNGFNNNNMVNLYSISNENTHRGIFSRKNNKKKTNKGKEIKFNTIGLFAVYFKKKRKKENYFYCAEYIKYATEKSNIDLKLPELPRPENFKFLDGSKVIYRGLLSQYSK